jgi:hypothetical protein
MSKKVEGASSGRELETRQEYANVLCIKKFKKEYNKYGFKTSKRVYKGDEAVVHHLGETART